MNRRSFVLAPGSGLVPGLYRSWPLLWLSSRHQQRGGEVEEESREEDEEESEEEDDWEEDAVERL